jgi:DNA ligase-associated metallophosphoesterase
MEIIVSDEKLVLGTEKFIYLPDYKTIVISDLHLGKIDHFRKHGIALPKVVSFEDIDRLRFILDAFDVQHCVFLGDLFHSEINKFWNIFIEFIKSMETIKFTLIKGNHDILDSNEYESANIQVVDQMTLGKLLFTHERVLAIGYYNIHGHIHPAVTMRGKAKQSITLPCYYFEKDFAIIPAFGKFTGLARIEPSPSSSVIVIVKDKLIKIKDSVNTY